MRCRIGSALSLRKNVNGGSPQGSILGNLLFTITTDKLADTITYERQNLNDCVDESMDSMDTAQVFPLDLSLARIVNDSPSELGINNITVEFSSVEHTYDFQENKSLVEEGGFVTEYFNHDDYTQSTPNAKGQFNRFVPPGNLVNSCLNDTYSSTTGLTFVYMKGCKKNLVLMDTSDGVDGSALMLSDTNNEIAISYDPPAGWVDREEICQYTYIDDMNGIERLNIKDCVIAISSNKQHLSLHAKASETFYNGVKAASEELGMRLNGQKTQLLCISAAGNQNVESYIRINNEKVVSGDELKICGFRFGSKPTVENQVVAIEAKFNARAWALRNLKRSGFNREELRDCYTSLVRPVFDYTAVVYDSLLTTEQSQRLERLQRRAIKIICGIHCSYMDGLERLGLTTLAERRRELVGKFIQKSLRNERFSRGWFPEKARNNYNTRHEQKYAEYKCNTERNRNNPLNAFRRRLNEQNI